MCARPEALIVIFAFLTIISGWVEATEESALFDYDQAVLDARQSGNPDLYRAALLQFAASREILARDEDGAFGPPFLLDAMRAYIKLSLLEAELERNDEADRYFGIAAEICKSVRESCAKNDIMEYERRFDEFETEKGRQW